MAGRASTLNTRWIMITEGGRENDHGARQTSNTQLSHQLQCNEVELPGSGLTGGEGVEFV